MDEEVIEVEAESVESVEPEVERYVQFIFDAKMVEFKVPWSQEQLSNAVTEVMADDGYMWVPQDEERGTGAFVNLNNCTNIKLLERETIKPLKATTPELLPSTADEPVEEAVADDAHVEEPIDTDSNKARDFLDRVGEKYDLPLGGSVIHGRREDKFIIALLCECLGLDSEDAEHALAEYRETM